jgi:hypothetical protein
MERGMTVEIKLTQGQVTVIDDIDTDLAEFKWTAAAQPGFRAVRMSAGPNRTMVYLHRVILSRMIGRPLSKTEITDHIDGNPLNNRRANLRIATIAENSQNRGKARTNKSGVKGVSRHRGTGKWRAVIGVNGKQIHLGLFTTPEAAHEAYTAAAEKFHGEFANTGVK